MLRTLALLLLISGAAMAKDGTIQAPKGPLQPKTKAEEFWQSEKGQWVDQQFQRLQNGEITLEQAQDEYAKKFGKPDMTAEPSPPLIPNVDNLWPTH